MPLVWYIVFAFLLILLNAFFVLAEFAVIKVRPTQIEALVESGHRSARLVEKIQANLDAYLPVFQVGITLPYNRQGKHTAA